jgi:hypothetical protein
MISLTTNFFGIAAWLTVRIPLAGIIPLIFRLDIILFSAILIMYESACVDSLAPLGVFIGFAGWGKVYLS